jgi:predicted MFS family arabinose efflux permease
LREHPTFRLLFWGQALSVVGDRITPVAIAFAVLGLGSASDLGLVLAAGGIPFALFALAGGVWADRVGRRRVMLASDIVRALSQSVTAALLLTGTAEVWMLAVLAFVYGTAAAVFMPALIGLIPQTVSPARLQEANGLLALTRSIASVAGPALAGVLVVSAGSGEAIAVDAATFVVSARVPGAHAPRDRAGRRRGRDRLGARALPGRPAARVVRGALALVADLGPDRDVRLPRLRAPVGLRARPALADTQLDGASSWAAIVAASGSAGCWATSWRLRLPLRRPVFTAALALVGASTQAAIIGSGLGTIGIAGLELLAGICVALFFTLWDLSIQEQVPAHAVSRVSAYDFSVSMGLMPLGMAMAGPIADALGLQATLIGMSAVGLAGALAWLAQPSVRRLHRPPSAAPPPVVPTPAPGAASPVVAGERHA